MHEIDSSRRSFFRQILAGSAVVSGLVLSGKKAGARQRQHDRPDSQVLYRETEAFRKYYESLR